MISEWIPIQKDQRHVRKEKEAARVLKDSGWWKQKLAEGICHHCGQNFTADQLTMDHLIPLARGGKSSKGNCVPSCKPCNSRKAYLTPAEMVLNRLREERLDPQD